MDLPPELREQIYGHYFDEYDMDYMEIWRPESTLSGSGCVTWYAEFPPVVCCDHQTRREALPLFWSCLYIRATLTADYGGSSGNLPHRVYWSGPIKNALRVAHRTVILSCIRTLEVYFEYLSFVGHAQNHKMVIAAVDLTHGTARSWPWPDVDLDPQKGRLAQRLIEVMDPILQEIRTRSGPDGKLQLGDGRKVNELLLIDGSLVDL
ncbi:hypothetical protein LTR95_013392, partial [Oleoguttula sp. CCFEE 5521]